MFIVGTFPCDLASIEPFQKYMTIIQKSMPQPQKKIMDHHFYSHKSWKLKNGFPQGLFPLQKVIHVQPSSGVQKKPVGWLWARIAMNHDIFL